MAEPAAEPAAESGAGPTVGAVAEGADGRTRLDDARIVGRLERLEEVLSRLEQVPGPTTETALDAVTLLVEVYGEALARVMDRLALQPGLAGELAGDELVGHLLVLHGLHPAPVAERVARAIDGVRPYLRSHGGDVQLVGIEDGVARVRLSARGCGSSTALLREAVDAAVAAAAPELSGVEPVRAGGPAAFIPAEALLSRPVPHAPEGVA
ncbi:Fe-S cluster biogenesis protein NfuA, 4Fe-4S-binding domain [Thermomonospora echinospora]|uniref:Fe-S cluster biogenesis protein NfuA, 4Fe-4S-binding domain n=1 Tax=Thermomonospora echinospora TaxID=1992 RepID=A0A1H6C790_9ACTN|nr:NifU family protein [Thermomonospora echinospora]SEG68839.1 Fe-S cluster biogenesis protein NfuA, 4Fe-4S-binding domain [Thermomonospora echinospora]